MKQLGAALFLLLGICHASADDFFAKAVSVSDGDTLMVVRNGMKIKIRLANIDAPEKDQPFGVQSRESLADLVLKKQVWVKTITMDQYGRTVALVLVNRYNVNESQVRRGWAWEYSHFHRDKNYIALQRDAQNARRGLWADRNPTPPWEWRKAHPSVRPGFAPASPISSKQKDASCGPKIHCSQMISCDEAHYYLTHCNLPSLDANQDGVPCESLCVK
ncbi:MAG: thermonuclease family protein [Gallionellaceae bacterium]|jgi:endonuclease YncB( thermonuclease family)